MDEQQIYNSIQIICFPPQEQDEEVAKLQENSRKLQRHMSMDHWRHQAHGPLRPNRTEFPHPHLVIGRVLSGRDLLELCTLSILELFLMFWGHRSWCDFGPGIADGEPMVDEPQQLRNILANMFHVCFCLVGRAL